MSGGLEQMLLKILLIDAARQEQEQEQEQTPQQQHKKKVESETTQNNGAENSKFWKVGTSYMVRTVTMYCLGKLKNINSQELLFENASWVADCGRFNNMLKTGEISELEPFIDDVILNRGSIVDATIWRHSLPSEVIQ